MQNTKIDNVKQLMENRPVGVAALGDPHLKEIAKIYIIGGQNEITRRKIQKGHSQNQENSREKNGETSQLRLAPLRSARRPLFLNAFPKITLKRGNPRFFLIDFFDSSQKWQTKKTPNTRRCWGLTIIYLWLSFLISCCALHQKRIIHRCGLMISRQSKSPCSRP